MALGTRPNYSPSEDTKAAHKKATEKTNAYENYSAFNSQYEKPLNDVTNQIINRGEFTYDYSTDPIYQSYKDTYTKQGQMAQRDAQAQATAMTGGLGSSYATQVGYNTYSQYMDKLMDTIPELTEEARSRYNDETTNLYNRATLLQNLKNQDYQAYRDAKNDAYNDMVYYQQKYNGLSEADFAYYQQHIDEWFNDRQFYYEKSLLDETNKQLANPVVYGV